MPRKRTSNAVGIEVRLGILGNGVHPQCVARGSTIKQLFEQTDFSMGESVKMNGRTVTANTKITQNGALVTSTSAVENAG